MIRLSYSSRPPIVPKQVYCDTSFLHALYMAENASRLHSLTPAGKRDAVAAQAMFNWGKSQGVEFVTSVLALEEEMNLMMRPVRDAATQRGLRGWKELRGVDAATFIQLLTRSRAAIGRFNKFVESSGIRLIGGGRLHTTDETNLPRRVYWFARLLVVGYELDPMDAFHIALARYFRIEWAATADSDWEATNRLNLICPR